jgi:hypothetical protein
VSEEVIVGQTVWGQTEALEKEVSFKTQDMQQVQSIVVSVGEWPGRPRARQVINKLCRTSNNRVHDLIVFDDSSSPTRAPAPLLAGEAGIVTHSMVGGDDLVPAAFLHRIMLLPCAGTTILPGM